MRRRVRQWYPVRVCALLLSRMLREARHARVQLSQYSIAEFNGSIVIKSASALRACATALHEWPALVCMHVTKKVVRTMDVESCTHQCAHGYTSVLVPGPLGDSIKGSTSQCL